MTSPVRILVCVTNDLVTDQRVHKMCMFLHSHGAQVTLIGRKLRGSLDIERPYTTKRLRLLFKSGPLFYGFFNLRLFFLLLFSRCEVIVANDLDTLWACAKAKRCKKRTELIYDSHEIFTEVPELAHSPRKKKIWKKIERRNIHKANAHITVNHSIARWFKQEYGITFHVVRNMPPRLRANERYQRASESAEPVKYLLVQGAGINVDRGNEELVKALVDLPNEIRLMIIGSGDVLPTLKSLAKELKLESRIRFLSKMPFDELLKHAQVAWLGITLDKDTNLNYRFSLPNKLFDFIQAGCPVLASNLPEVAAIVNTYQVGIITPSHSPTAIASVIMGLHQSNEKYALLKSNCLKAAEELCWENEIPVLEKVYGPYLRAQR